jgi:hypothetical protein
MEATKTDHLDTAAAALASFHAAKVQEYWPVAMRQALQGPSTLAGWLYREAACGVASHLGPIDEGELLFVGSLSVPSLLVLLFDERQPGVVKLAALDALRGHFKADSAVRANVEMQASAMARRAVRHLVEQQDVQRVQAFTRAESSSLYGDEHGVTGVAPMPAVVLDMAAVADEAQRGKVSA